MTTEQSVLARQRLCLGITLVGFWVVVSVAGLCWLRWTRSTDSTLNAVAVALGLIAVQGVFDAVGGWRLMPSPRSGALGFLRGWTQGLLVHSAVLAGVSVLGVLSLRLTGGFCGGVALASVLLAAGRGFLCRAVSGGGIRQAVLEGGKKVMVHAVDDPSFTGGIIGFGRGATIVIPEGWLHRVPRPELAVELFRRRWDAARCSLRTRRPRTRG